MSKPQTGLVHFRTPTYRRPLALRRALLSLQEQTWSNWVYDVYDDDPDRSAEAVCHELGDERVSYRHNVPQLFASKNIDHCFSRSNPYDADYFFVLEDDNFVLDTFIEANIAVCRQEKVNLVLRNQVVEFASGTENARLGTAGILDGTFSEGRYDPLVFRRSLLVGIGVSNGGMFWTTNAKSDLDTPYSCTATMQEYLRTFSVREPIYVAMQPLAVWAENAEQTTRNAGLRSSYIWRELNLKRNLQAIRRHVWRNMSAHDRNSFMADQRFPTDTAIRAEVLVRSGILSGARHIEAPLKAMKFLGRAAIIGLLGKRDDELLPFLTARNTPL